MRHFELLKNFVFALAVLATAVVVIVSIVLGQTKAPYHFRSVGRETSTGLPFLRAFVRDGNMTLIKSIFPDLIKSRYSDVFEPYISQDILSTRIESVERRVPESRDLEIAKGFLAIRERDTKKAKSHFDKAIEIDPTVVLPTLDIDLESSMSVNP